MSERKQTYKIKKGIIVQKGKNNKNKELTKLKTKNNSHYIYNSHPPHQHTSHFWRQHPNHRQEWHSECAQKGAEGFGSPWQLSTRPKVLFFFKDYSTLCLSLLFLSVDQQPRRRSGMEKQTDWLLDGGVEAQKNGCSALFFWKSRQQLSIYWQLYLASRPTSRGHFGGIASCVGFVKMSSRSLRRPAVKVLRWIQWSRLFDYNHSICRITASWDPAIWWCWHLLQLPSPPFSQPQ